MKAALATVLLSFALGAGAAMQESATTSALLRWRNGESIGGELVAVTDETLTWKTAMFADPLRVKLAEIRRVDHKRPPMQPTDSFSVILRDGSHLYGEVAGFTKETVTLKTTRHGVIELKRSEVLALNRWKGGRLIGGGTPGDGPWKLVAATVDDQNNGFPMINMVPSRGGRSPSATPELSAGAGGSLPMRAWNTTAALEAKLPPSVDASFRLTSSKAPDFAFSFKGAARELRIETWGEELVVAAGSDFRFIRKVQESEREIGLRLFWDSPSRKCSIFSADGKKLIDWEMPPSSDKPADKPAPKVPQTNRPLNPPPAITTGLILQNKGRDLTLETLHVRAWDGSAPAGGDFHKPRVEMTDGHALTGEVLEGSAESLQMQAGPDQPAQAIPVDQIDAIVLSEDRPKPTETEPVMTFADGTLLMGRLAPSAEGLSAIKFAPSTKPLPVRLDGLRQLLLANTTPPPAPGALPFVGYDKISLQGFTLHGHCVGKNEPQPRWLPVGGLEPVRLKEDAVPHIERAPSGDALPEQNLTLFYTQSGDILRGHLRSLDTTGVEIDNSYVEKTKIPLSDLAAIQFASAGPRTLSGFRDPEWRITSGKGPKLGPETKSVQLEEGSGIGHPTALLAQEVKFHGSTQSFGATRVRLFCAGTERTGSTNFLIVQMGNRLTTGIEIQEGNMSRQQQGAIQTNKGNEFRFLVLEKAVEFYVDGVLWQTIASDAGTRVGGGLIIEPASAWGNSVEPITIKDFSSIPSPGLPPPPAIAPATKQQALTVPRFRKEAPPKHVLLGTNGDLLRGEVEAITSTHIGFRSGLENIRVPRERVRAIVWLQPPQAGAETKPAEKPVDFPELDQPAEMPPFPSLPISTWTQIIRSQFPGVQLIIPKGTEQSRSFSVQGTTLRQIVQEIADALSLSYHLEPGKKIVFTAGAANAKPSRNLALKVYWLPRNAFANSGAALGMLKNNGIPFDEGATATWDPATGQLTVVNTAENHAKLGPLFQEKYKQNASPTHWIQLMSGARQPLQVKEFTPDTVVGWHPQFGQCRIPLAQVHLIDAAPPARAGLAEALIGWRLTSAPEPVLPETGGESSALLGKEGRAFALPLLGGGEWKMGPNRGKVIVLDFWATWCGPCIKSLPSLIESFTNFPNDKAILIGVNQGEAPEVVKRFLETRGWNLTTVLDGNQNIGRLYGVDGIPFTVVIAQDGKVAFVKTGYSPEGAKEVAAAVQKLLDKAQPAPAGK